MKNLMILLCITTLYACKSGRNAAEATDLNDAAIRMYATKPNDTNNTKAVINMLDKAIAMDSTLYRAYWNKAGCQMNLRQYDNALATFKKIVTFQPYNGFAQTSIGNVLMLKGDSVAAIPHYESSLNLYQHILDTMNVNTAGYHEIEMEKALNLVLLNKQQEGDAILNRLYNTTTDSLHKRMYKAYMGISKKVIIASMTGAHSMAAK